MLSLKRKLSSELRNAVENKSYKNYKVIIHCTTMIESIEKKVKTYGSQSIRSIPDANCISALLSSKAIERLIEYPEVNHIEFDSLAYLCGRSILNSNGIAYEERYHLTGKDVCIGLVDSGVYPHHDIVNPHNKIRGFEDLINGMKYPYDDNGHGTFIAGIICSSGGLSKGTYKGIAENSRIYCIKAFNSLGRAYVSDTLYAINTLIEKSLDYNIKVICLPFELTDFNPFILSLYSKLFENAWNNNITVIVPSGHNGNGESSITGIAALRNCITVGGLDTTNGIKPYKYSSGGPFGKIDKPDFSAACVDICSLSCNKDYIPERNGLKVYPASLESPYISYTGTSCAAAYAAGICSLLYENKPNITCKDILSLIKVSCRPLELPKQVCGAGMIDLNKVLP